MGDEKRRVPAAALRCVVGAFELGDNGDDAKTAPFKMVARSGDSIDHWFWGTVVHDLEGMQLNSSKVAIDYIHDDNQVIGYANRFDIETGNLEASGALTPYKESDRASEIVYKSKQGVPYQASINFAGDGIKVEEFGPGQSVNVNGRQFSGPVTVIREWPLRGIAVCPYGADSNTATEFSETNNQEVTVMSQEPASTNEETVADDAAAVDSQADTDKSVDASEATPAVEAAEQPESTPETQLEPAAALRSGQNYLERFGDQGGVWFAQGKSWDDCLVLHEQSLKEKIRDLETKLATRQEGEESPVEFNASDDAPAKRGGLENKIRGMMEKK